MGPFINLEQTKEQFVGSQRLPEGVIAGMAMVGAMLMAVVGAMFMAIAGAMLMGIMPPFIAINMTWPRMLPPGYLAVWTFT